MPTSRRRGSSSDPESNSAEEELRLPRAPGVIRRYWARHPRFADILIALICLTLSWTPAMVSWFSGPPVNFLSQAALLIGCVLLLKRRRWSVTVLVAAWVAAATYLTLGVPTGGPLVLVASYSLAVYRSTRTAWRGFGCGLGALTVLSLSLWSTGAITMTVAINAVVGQLVLGLIGTLIGVNVGNRKRYLEAVIDRSRQLLVERDQHARLAAAAERERIAREMHDIVSHSLTVVVALSDGAAATSDPERARAASSAAAATARNALTEMRSMLGVLRDGDADAPLAPLDPVAPSEIVADAQRAGYGATIAVRGEPDAAPALRFAIGRIVQEGVTNALRHAPMMSGVDVRIDYDADPIVIEIVNDGVRGTGSGDAGGSGDHRGSSHLGGSGFGIRGLVERATLLGGTVVSAPAGRGRWMLRAELPSGAQGSGSGSGADSASDSGPGSVSGSGSARPIPGPASAPAPVPEPVEGAGSRLAAAEATG